ncbi:hypothetical protein [Caldanaerobius polysaccharolyticus]|uniref:hypothetical protein n=1 Tax=Caldanaerobius polysaccharolyticus TaxID=44256 RepID=UPI00047DE709|nr:hypothetical protein [Caldanaerobius polysaccharolyticus]
MAQNIGLRDYFEKQGYKVNYDNKTGNITISDPKTGHSATVPKGTYSLVNNRAYVSPDYARSVGHTLFFGSPEAYAEAIKTKEAAGIPLDDPAAAAQFKQNYPQLFSTPQTQQQQQTTPSDWWAQFLQDYMQSSEARINALQSQLSSLQNQNQFLSSMSSQLQSQNQALSDLIRQLQNVQPPQLPTQETKVETVQENVPVEGVEQTQPQQQTTQTEAPKGASGFVLQGGTLPSTPAVTAEALYDYYRRLTGREDESVRQFLAGPQFQAALQGAVPAWMAADPIWRLLLTRAGVNPKQLRLDTLRERLNKGD